MKIKFTTGFRPKGDAADIPTYEAGQEYVFKGPVAEGYARKYIARGLAVDVTNEKPAKVAKEELKVEKPVEKPAEPVAPTVTEEAPKAASGFFARN